MSGGAIAVLVARARARIVDHFVEQGATSAGKAIDYAPHDHRIDRRMFDRMVAFGAIRSTQPARKEKPAQTGPYWLDERRAVDFRKESLARVLGIIALAGFAAAGAIAFGG